jgi:hypothetical protein
MPSSPTFTYRLFKYRSLAGDNRYYTCRIVAHGRIYYAAPSQLNDPFDGRFSVNMDGAPLNAFGLSKRDEIKARAEAFLYDQTNQIVSVLSLSEVRDNVLMWSHYADSHAGICLELTIQTSEELHQVRYTDARPQFYFADVRERDRDQVRFRNSIISTLTTKASHWAYEEEWRCIDFDGPGERPLPRGTLSGIIFGCRTSDSDKEMVRDWVRLGAQDVTFYQATEKDGAFALDIRPIS